MKYKNVHWLLAELYLITQVIKVNDLSPKTLNDQIDAWIKSLAKAMPYFFKEIIFYEVRPNRAQLKGYISWDAYRMRQHILEQENGYLRI